MKYQKAVTFSYDDGVEQDRRLVEIFNHYGMKATFNLNTGIQTPESRFDIEGVEIRRMSQEGLKELYAGHEIAVHGLKHLAPVDMDEKQLEEEFLTDAKNIEKLYGVYPIGMAYAYGAYDDISVEYLKKIGIRYGRTVGASHDFKLPKDPMRLKATCHHEDEMLFELAEKFIRTEPKPGEQMLFFVWGHSYEFHVRNNWERIEKLCELFSKQDDIFFGTNAECLF